MQKTAKNHKILTGVRWMFYNMFEVYHFNTEDIVIT